MKRKIIALVMAICVAVGAAGCGDAVGNGGSGISIVTINGEKYDLSGDFQKVVGEMAENGLKPIDALTGYRYDEGGKRVKRDPSDWTNAFNAWEMSYAPTLEFSAIIVDRYEFQHSWKYDYTFETADGITQDSDADDLEALEGYLPCRGIFYHANDACRAIYIDGKIVDLEEYRDVYEEWLRDAEENGYGAASKKYLNGRYANELIMGFPYYPDNMEAYIKQTSYLEESMLMTFAFQEACEALEAGEIRSFDIIWYENENDGTNAHYLHYYKDENWDRNKFKQEE